MKISRTRALAVSGALALTVTACNDSPPVHTTDYYRAHRLEAQQRLEYCDRQGLSTRDADCVNAAQGQFAAMMTAKPTVNPWK